MKLSGLHLLLTYQCNLECDHCFVWGSPWQSGTMTLHIIQEILKQARSFGYGTIIVDGSRSLEDQFKFASQYYGFP